MVRRHNVIIQLKLTRAEMLEFRKYVWRFRQERRERTQRMKRLAWEGNYIVGRSLAGAEDRTEAEIHRIATEYAERQTIKDNNETGTTT